MKLEIKIEETLKEMEFLKAKNILSIINSDKTINKEKSNEYYEKQLNDSNITIKKMGEMIQELEKQIEELQRELENNNYIEAKSNKKNNKNDSNNIGELIDLIKKKDKEIKQYQVEIRILNDEKSKLYEDNTKMYTNLDHFQKYICNLIEENKNLKIKLNKNINTKENSQIKEIKTLNESEINEDDISKYNCKEFNSQLSSKINDIGKENIKENVNKIINIRYNGLNDSKVNDSIQRDISIKNIEKDIKSYLKTKDEGNKENESNNKNNNEFYFEYDGKENEELSD